MRPAVFALFLLPVAALAQPPAKFESAAGKFAAAFPGKPTETKKPIRAGSELMVHVTQFEDRDGGRLVLWNDITAKGFDPAKVLDGAAKGIAQQGKLVSDKETTVGPDKVAARDVTADTPQGYRVRTLLLVANTRLYQVTVTGSNEFVTGPLAEAFRTSFELRK